MIELVMKNELSGTYQKERPSLLSFIRNRISDSDAAEDILQDIFQQALLHLNALQTIDNLTGWLYVSARNRIVDWYRKKRHSEISLQTPVEESTLESLVTDSGLQVEDQAIKKQIGEMIIEAVDSLPDNQRSVFVAQAIEGKTFRKLSEETGIPINTLLSRKRYAVLSLREILADLRQVLNEQ